jgi:hypothetical protein
MFRLVLWLFDMFFDIENPRGLYPWAYKRVKK